MNPLYEKILSGEISGYKQITMSVCSFFFRYVILRKHYVSKQVEITRPKYLHVCNIFCVRNMADIDIQNQQYYMNKNLTQGQARYSTLCVVTP